MTNDHPHTFTLSRKELENIVEMQSLRIPLDFTDINGNAYDHIDAFVALARRFEAFDYESWGQELGDGTPIGCPYFDAIWAYAVIALPRLFPDPDSADEYSQLIAQYVAPWQCVPVAAIEAIADEIKRELDAGAVFTDRAHDA